MFRFGAVIAEVQSGGNLCWAAQCILLRVMGEIWQFWAGPLGTAHQGYNSGHAVQMLNQIHKNPGFSNLDRISEYIPPMYLLAYMVPDSSICPSPEACCIKTCGFHCVLRDRSY